MKRLATQLSPTLAGVLVLWAVACDEAPTHPTDDLVTPQFAAGGKAGKPPKYDWVPLRITLRDDPGDGIKSDGKGPYEHDDVCGVRAAFPPNEGGDLLLGTDDRPLRKKAAEQCGGPDPRGITADLNNPVEGTDAEGIILGDHYLNVDNIQSLTPGDGIVLRKASLLVRGHCYLIFGPDEFPDSDQVQVWRNGDGTWTVQTQLYPNDVAFCRDGVRAYHMPFELTAVILEE